MKKDEVRNVEVGRSPLRYKSARKFLLFADLSALWLATGEGPQRMSFPMPTLEKLGITGDPLFTHVFERYLQPGWITASLARSGGVSASHSRLWSTANTFSIWAKSELFPRVPDPDLQSFYAEALRMLHTSISKLGPVTNEEFSERRTALFTLEALHKDKMELTHESIREIVAPVRTLESLLAEARRLAKGRRPELLKALGVTTETLSRYLSGHMEPGGEVTLKLLNWVERQERTKK